MAEAAKAEFRTSEEHESNDAGLAASEANGDEKQLWPDLQMNFNSFNLPKSI